ncbi:Regulator of sigma-E protease RseP [Pelagimonas phthalicica]|uniref:Zinc metalloprotease n=1 Tax=Pelagimonas phthalicica TaxID=1037362 RepID=A0A238JBN3_9RHOB|nr:RIP metalloprotease RseP [Pelagimonas phthalicica]TDS91053.1 regulator of sigma E protease [Pelagimonas phthalicica]SMX28100.1 Regulator of sigma-E protease RseP [Pelagimonas phthalicica]
MDLTSLIPQFGGLIWTLVFFVVALSIIVAIHEYGHYIVGKKSGIYPEVFSLGFGPVLWSRYDDFGTKWQIAAIPFGGFVKFRGDANASGGIDGDAIHGMDDATMRSTMHGAPLWARTATVAAGPVFNFILSIVLFTGIILARGIVSEPLTVGELRILPVTQELQSGDVILEIEGGAPPSFEDGAAYEAFMQNLPQKKLLDYTVLRDGSETTVSGPYVYPPIVTQVAPRSAARDAGLQQGDVITAINGEAIFAFDQLKEKVEGSEGATLALTLWRDGETVSADLTPKRVDEPQPDNTFKTFYRIGVIGGILFEPATETPGFGEAFFAGVNQVWRIMTGSLSGMWHMITGAISTCNLSGPIGIAETSGDMASQGTTNFIWFVAVLSTAVGLINLFPIPVLDGGHLCFYAYEAVTGKQPSERALDLLMKIGLIVVLSVMILGVSSDLFC